MRHARCASGSPRGAAEMAKSEGYGSTARKAAFRCPVLLAYSEIGAKGARPLRRSRDPQRGERPGEAHEVQRERDPFEDREAEVVRRHK